MSRDKPDDPLTRKVKLAKAEKNDIDFLRETYFRLRKDEFSTTGWVEQQFCPFLMKQHNYQTQAYRMSFPDAENSIIYQGTSKADRLLVNRIVEEILSFDTSMMPEHPNFGIVK